MDYQQITKDKLEKIKEELCNNYFKEINPENIRLGFKVTTENSRYKVYAYTRKDTLLPFNPQYYIEIGLPLETLNDAVVFPLLSSAALAHEFGHIIKRHPGSYFAGLAIMLDIVGKNLKPLKNICSIMLTRLETQADDVAKEKGLGAILKDGAKIGRRINGLS